MGILEPYMKKPIVCATMAEDLTACYREQGIKLASVRTIGQEPLRGELLLAPQSFLQSPQAALLGNNFETAFASGWVETRRGSYDKGFLLSDHADWDDLVRTVQETKAKRVYVQHRGNGALVRHLRSLGLEAFPDSELKPKNPNQLVLF